MSAFEDIISTIAKLGIVSGIAVYLIYWITCNLNNEIKELNENISKLRDKIDELTTIIETLKNFMNKK